MTDTSNTVVPKPQAPAPDDSPHDRRLFWLAAAIVAMAFVIIVALFLKPIPADNKDVLNTVIGLVVGTGFGSVVGFYFGSSESSKSKDTTITKLSSQ